MPRSDVMEQDYSTVAYLGQPGAEIVRDSFVGVKAVDVQKVDGPVVKLRERFLEASAQKIGKLPIVTIVVIVDLIENFLAIKSGVLISVPVVDGVAQAGKFALFDGLAKSEVSLAPVSAEFDDKAWL
jgi:hypothetical protein